MEAPVERRKDGQDEGKLLAHRAKNASRKNHPAPEEIALRAYHIYLQRAGTPGNELEDWIAAERQLVDENPRSIRTATAKPVRMASCGRKPSAKTAVA